MAMVGTVAELLSSSKHSFSGAFSQRENKGLGLCPPSQLRNASLLCGRQKVKQPNSHCIQATISIQPRTVLPVTTSLPIPQPPDPAAVVAAAVVTAAAVIVAAPKAAASVVTPYQRWTKKATVGYVADEKLEVVQSMTGWASDNLLPMLKPVGKSWQPQDFLPDFASPTFYEEVRELQERASNLPDDYLICLVGDMITEEALPTYQAMLNTFEGTKDPTACSNGPWAVWARGWTAEENRHGDLLNKYLYVSGRVDMRMVEKTTQYLIGSGMDPQIDNDPYNGFVYTSFQERATFISHNNTASHAKKYGDSKLANICKMIAADEKRHEIAYTRVMSRVFELDPVNAVLSFAEMMKKKITMPAHFMFDGADANLFDNYAAVAQRLGVYTANDYVDVMEHLIATWNVSSLTGLTGDAKRAQDYLCNLPQRFRKLAERADTQIRRRRETQPVKSFSWVFNREVKLM